MLKHRGVLIVPNVALGGWASYSQEGRRNNSLAHGLLHVATELNAAGHDVSVLDLRQYPSISASVQAVIDRQPHFVGVGAMTVDFGIARDFCLHLKHLAPDITTVLGGVHASVATPDAEACDAFDFIVTGEGESAMVELVSDAFAKHPRVIKGRMEELDNLLPIDRSLVDYASGELLHGGSWNSKYPYVTVITARGCPFQCSFCAPVSKTMFTRPRQRSVGHVMFELRRLKKLYDFQYVEFIDDYFTLNDSWVEEFIDAWWANRFGGVLFNIATRADTVVKKPEMFMALRKAGLDTVNVGFESASDRILQFLGKGTTAEQNLAAGRFLKQLGLKIIANVMFGFPDETPEEIVGTLSLLEKIEADFPSPAYFTPYPGSFLAEQYGKDMPAMDYAQMHRYASGVKLKGVDYEQLKAILGPGMERLRAKAASVASNA